MLNELTSYVDFAQIVLYLFWIFFAGLIWWLRKEDRREGYPLETDNPRVVGFETNPLIPAPKTFILPHGEGEYLAPSFARDEREIDAERVITSSGSAYEPNGDPMGANIGPGTYAERHDAPELTREGHKAIVPMRVADDYDVNAGRDPRGWDVVAGDDEVVGTVKDIWVDRSESLPRFLEVELADGDEVRLLPITQMKIRTEPERVEVTAIMPEHFASVPTTKDADSITVLEEEKICAFFASGWMYATPKRIGPLV